VSSPWEPVGGLDSLVSPEPGRRQLLATKTGNGRKLRRARGLSPAEEKRQNTDRHLRTVQDLSSAAGTLA
jgi:hypothetical protein